MITKEGGAFSFLFVMKMQTQIRKIRIMLNMYFL